MIVDEIPTRSHAFAGRRSHHEGSPSVLTFQYSADPCVTPCATTMKHSADGASRLELLFDSCSRVHHALTYVSEGTHIRERTESARYMADLAPGVTDWRQVARASVGRARHPPLGRVGSRGGSPPPEGLCARRCGRRGELLEPSNSSSRREHGRATPHRVDTRAHRSCVGLFEPVLVGPALTFSPRRAPLSPSSTHVQLHREPRTGEIHTCRFP